jgi:hypothetical protein
MNTTKGGHVEGGSVPTGEANEPTGTDQPYAVITVRNGDYRVWTALIGPDDADGNPTRHEAYGYLRASFGAYRDAIDYRDMLIQLDTFDRIDYEIERQNQQDANRE